MFRCKMIGRFSMVLPYVLNTIIIKSLGKLFLYRIDLFNSVFKELTFFFLSIVNAGLTDLVLLFVLGIG